MAKRLSGLEQALKGFDGEPIIQTDLTGEPRGKVIAREMLAAICGRGSSPDPIRAVDVGLKVYHAKKSIDLDDADITLLATAVTADKGSTDLAKAWLLKILEAAKSLDKEGKE